MNDIELSSETLTLETTGWLNAWDCNKPFVTFMLPAELSQYFAPTEYTAYIPPTIKWPYYSCGEFAVDLTITLSADTFEIVSIDDVKPNPDLEGGF